MNPESITFIKSDMLKNAELKNIKFYLYLQNKIM